MSRTYISNVCERYVMTSPNVAALRAWRVARARELVCRVDARAALARRARQ